MGRLTYNANAMKRIILPAVIALFTLPSIAYAQMEMGSGVQHIQNQSRDISACFEDFSATWFFAESLGDFDAASASGRIHWKRHSMGVRQALNTSRRVTEPLKSKDFPAAAFSNDPDWKFYIDFVDSRTVRIRMLSAKVPPVAPDEVMLTGDIAAEDWRSGVRRLPSEAGWQVHEDQNAVTYTSACGSLRIDRSPWRISLYDSKGRLLTCTRSMSDYDVTQVKLTPFAYIRRGSDNARMFNPVFSLMPGEKIFGCGESAEGLDKVGQKLHLYVTDPQGPEGLQMYKPIPFYMSNRGYGVFLHSSAPMTVDFGQSYTGNTKLFMADEALDMFMFIGTPAEILNGYTSLTGKTEMPPLWTFGTWMSRITYKSQAEGYEVAQALRKHRIPADVIHFDTGWFSRNWQCDYIFDKTRFPDPRKMISDLKEQGFRVSLWQLPYFSQNNVLYDEIVEKGLAVKSAAGSLPYDDAVLDFTNPATAEWYRDKIAGLLEMGVSAIKVDFGEAAPVNGFYHNGRGGLYEHNLYPVRYNKAVAEITKQVTGESVIWARSAWAGSQRYPLHWGGDAANTDRAMLSSLHAGLSLGLSGFCFWSHDIGGFVKSTPEELYRRWLPFGFLCSHSRSHGEPPTEPWLYGEEFTDYYRRCAEMKYRLMPYVYAQAKDCTERGLPMLRALFVEFPGDAGAWNVEDEYMFGKDILVAPMFEGGTGGRDVYLPEGKWTDMQSGKVYSSGWHKIAPGEIEAVIMVRDGAVIPIVPVAQCTDMIEWDKISLQTWFIDKKQGEALIFRPGDKEITRITKSRRR